MPIYSIETLLSEKIHFDSNRSNYLYELACARLVVKPTTAVAVESIMTYGAQSHDAQSQYRKSLQSWCDKNVVGKFVDMNGYYWLFERYEDALHFSMMWE